MTRAPAPSRRRRLLLLSLPAALALPAHADHGPRQRSRAELDGWAVASFELTDQHGRALTERRLRGRWTFMLFGDGAGCGGRCAAPLAALTGLQRRLAGADVLQTTQLLFVSLDPRDTPARLRDALADHGPGIIGAVGTPSMLQRLTDPLRDGGAAAGRRDLRGVLLLIGPDATIRAELLPPFDPPTLTAAYLRMRLGRY